MAMLETRKYQWSEDGGEDEIPLLRKISFWKIYQVEIPKCEQFLNLDDRHIDVCNSIYILKLYLNVLYIF